jgi:hypothetical protein
VADSVTELSLTVGHLDRLISERAQASKEPSQFFEYLLECFKRAQSKQASSKVDSQILTCRRSELTSSLPRFSLGWRQRILFCEQS